MKTVFIVMKLLGLCYVVIGTGVYIGDKAM